MSRRNFVRMLAGVLLAAAATHAALATVVTASIDRLYTNRMFDVRRWPGADGTGLRLVGSYLRERAPRLETPVTMFAGSSVTHGYPWTATQAFPAVYGRESGKATINAGILGLDLSGINDWILCAAVRNRLRFSTVVIEVPVVNTASQLANYHRANSPVPPLSNCDGSPDPSYAGLAWSRPFGVGWAVFLWERETQPKPDEVMEVKPVPKGYFTGADEFAAIEGVFSTQLLSTISQAYEIAEAVLVLPSPVYTAGLSDIGEDRNAVEAQGRHVLSICAQTQAVCLDASFLNAERKYFMNFTHLNQAGHRILGQWLARRRH